jgi:hypothetical protein
LEPALPTGAGESRALNRFHVAPHLELSLLEGEYPSPTLVVDGLDVTAGAPVSGEPRCRFDLPTPAQIRKALSKLR